MIQIQPDIATQIRQGEELNLDSLSIYLKNNIDNFGEIVEVTQFPGGFSNLTYLVKTTNCEYVLRRAPIGANIKSAHDMSREYKVLTLLKPLYGAVPKAILYCDNESIIGATFYLMEKVSGIILRGNGATNYQIEPEKMRQLSECLIDNLAALHQIDIENSELKNIGKPEGYVERQVIGWVSRYEKSKTDQIENMDQVAIWLNEHKPKDQKPTLIHNDYKYDNVVFDGEMQKIIAVLDWEMTTIGDPLMDLGAVLAYWCESNDGDFLKTMNITWLPGNLSRQQVVDRYALITGIDVSDIIFYYVFGLFKNAVIIQQIYARWKLGITKDPRFEKLIFGVYELSAMALGAIKSGKI
jgi:aminoglycoside phosphotransferase (APT) family kinase protein